jgi:hypothetical protein
MLKELKWHVANWITALMMAVVGFGLIGFGRKWYHLQKTRKP